MLTVTYAECLVEVLLLGVTILKVIILSVIKLSIVTPYVLVLLQVFGLNLDLFLVDLIKFRQYYTNLI
jgi:hypothetical protein